jgi:hypothetical protein
MNQMRKYQPVHQSGFDRVERQKVFKDIYLSPIAFKTNTVQTVKELAASLEELASQYNAKLLYIYWPDQQTFTDQYGDYGHVYCRFTAGPKYTIITDPNQCQNTTLQQLYQMEQGQETMYNKLQSWQYNERATAVKNAKNWLSLWDITVNIQNYRQMHPRQLAIAAPPATVTIRPTTPDTVIWNDFPSINVRTTIEQDPEIQAAQQQHNDIRGLPITTRFLTTRPKTPPLELELHPNEINCILDQPVPDTTTVLQPYRIPRITVADRLAGHTTSPLKPSAKKQRRSHSTHHQ